MKILLLILASTGPEYAGFEALWRRYMHSHPAIDAYFYKGNPDLAEDSRIDGDTIWVKCSDTLDAVYEKLMRTFRAILPWLDAYELVYRTNLSSFLDFKVFVPYCETLSKPGCYAGVSAKYKGISFASGAGFALSPDLIHRLVAEQPPPVLLDDVTLGKTITDWGIPIQPANRFDVQTETSGRYEHPPLSSEHLFHYRAKTDNRARDVALLTSVAHRCGAL